MKTKEIDVLELNKLGYNEKLNDGQIMRECKYNNYFIYDKDADVFYKYDYDTKNKSMGIRYAYYIENAKNYKVELIDEEEEKQNAKKRIRSST